MFCGNGTRGCDDQYQRLHNQCDQRGRDPYEPELAEFVETHSGNRFTATTEYDVARETDITFLALPTPSNENGRIDTSIIEEGATTLGEVLAEKDEDHVVVTKSTSFRR